VQPQPNPRTVGGDRTTADIIVETLIIWGVPVIFGVVGDGIGPLIEAAWRHGSHSASRGCRGALHAARGHCGGSPRCLSASPRDRATRGHSASVPSRFRLIFHPEPKQVYTSPAKVSPIMVFSGTGGYRRDAILRRSKPRIWHGAWSADFAALFDSRPAPFARIRIGTLRKGKVRIPGGVGI